MLRKSLTAIVLILALAAAASMVYGIYYFPDAPISQCGDGCFRNKQGRPKTAEDYERFRRWLVTTPGLVIAAIGSGMLLTIIEKRRGPDGRSSLA